MEIKEYKNIKLDIKPDLFKEKENHYLISNDKGEVNLYNENFEKIKNLKIDKLVDVDFIPSKKLIFYATQDEIKVIDYNNNKITSLQIKSKYITIQNNLLWTISYVEESEEKDYIEIVIYELDTFKKKTSLKIEGDTYHFINRAYNDNTLVLLFGGGDDYFTNYLIELKDDKLSSKFIGEEYIDRIVFNDTGNLMILMNDTMLDVYSYPEESPFGGCDLEEEDIDSIPYYSFLNDNNLLLLSSNGFLIFNIEDESFSKMMITDFDGEIKGFELFHNKIFALYQKEGNNGILEIEISEITKKI